jgi:hypothetical protein
VLSNFNEIGVTPKLSDTYPEGVVGVLFIWVCAGVS